MCDRRGFDERLSQLQQALQDMLPRGEGHRINMASVAGLNGAGSGAAYIAVKHGVIGLIKQM